MCHNRIILDLCFFLHKTLAQLLNCFMTCYVMRNPSKSLLYCISWHVMYRKLSHIPLGGVQLTLVKTHTEGYIREGRGVSGKILSDIALADYLWQWSQSTLATTKSQSEKIDHNSQKSTSCFIDDQSAYNTQVFASFEAYI